MVDHLSRVKLLTIRLGLQRDSKKISASGIQAKADIDKSPSPNVDSAVHDKLDSRDPDKTDMRRTRNDKYSGLRYIDDDDDVFYTGTNGNNLNVKQTYTKPMSSRTPKSPMNPSVTHIFDFSKKAVEQERSKLPMSSPVQLSAKPVVNKRLRNIKRPLEATRSVPVSPAAIPDKRKLKEEKMRTDLDFICAELVSLRQKDQEIAKTLLKLYTEIQKLKVKNSCLLHQELLEEATYNAAEAEEVPDMCDAPHKYMSKILLSRGVTKQNLAWRRFSCS